MADEREAVLRAAKAVHGMLPDRHAWPAWEDAPTDRRERCIEIAEAVRRALAAGSADGGGHGTA